MALHKNVYASVVEDMIVKVGACQLQRAHEQLPPGARAPRGQCAGQSGSRAVLSKGQGRNGTEMISFRIFHLNQA